MIKTRKELASLLQEAWKKEVCVSINGFSFLTNMTMISITSTCDGIANNYIAVTTKDGALMGGALAKNITSIFFNEYFEVSIND